MNVKWRGMGIKRVGRVVGLGKVVVRVLEVVIEVDE